MKFELEKITRKSLEGLKPYSTARDDFKGVASVYLDANENPFSSRYNRYPDPSQQKLRTSIAELKQVNHKQVILGNGSDELIDLLFRAFCEPGIDNVVIPQPTYGMYAVCAGINNIEARLPSLSTNFDLNLNAISKSIDAHTKMIFLCSPNNPSGNLLTEESVEVLLASFNGLVVIDEAYIDFVKSKGSLQHLDKYANLIVLQTFSKAWGLAGLRLGVGFASKEIIELLLKIKPPYNINTLTQELTLAALTNDQDKDGHVDIIIHERNELMNRLNQFSFVTKVYPSQANFILVQFKNATDCYLFLLKNGVIVRDRSSAINCENCLRITIGTPKENQLLIEALTEYEKKSIVY